MININKEYSNKINAITHSAPHHADDVFATAMLSFVVPIELYRTRNLDIIKETTNVIVYDVGGVYDPSVKKYDHHQKGFEECYEDGTKFSSAGLIWREYADEIIVSVVPEINKEMVTVIKKRVYEDLILGIDAIDNGVRQDFQGMTISDAIAVFNKTWDGEGDADVFFVSACNVASEILEHEIIKVASSEKGRVATEDAILQCDGEILVMDRFIGGWMDVLLCFENEKATKILYGVFPALDGNWNIQAVPPDIDNKMLQKKPFPKDWRGLKGEDLEEACGIKESVFCHMAGFFAVAKNKEAAIEMAKKAVAY